MKTDVKTLYPPRDDDYFSVCGYQPMIDSFGKVLVQVSDDDYQGDTRVLVEDADGFFGFLVFGWGSCSGCDALQGCENYDDLQRLYDRLKDAVRWFDDAEDTLRFFEEHDWEGDYTFHDKETREFVGKCKDLLAKRLTGTAVCEKNPLDCVNRTFCHEPGGCCHEAVSDEKPADMWNNGLLLEDDDSEAGDEHLQRALRLSRELGLEEAPEAGSERLARDLGLEEDADRWYDRKMAEAAAECAEMERQSAERRKAEAADPTANEKKVGRLDPKWEDRLREEMGFEPRPLLTFVWEDVLSDYTQGIVVAVARDLEEALSLIRRESEYAWRVVKDRIPRVVKSPVAFVVQGGS